MAYPWEVLLEEACVAIAAGYPAAIENGIYTSDEIARTSWEVPPGYPYVVVHQGMISEGDWGLTNDAWEPVVEVYLIVAETEAQSADPSAARHQITRGLMAIKDAMRAGSFTESQASMLGVPEMDFGPNLDVNAILLAKNVPVLGGRVAFRFTCGETAH